MRVLRSACATLAAGVLACAGHGPGSAGDVGTPDAPCRETLPGFMRPDWRHPWAGAVALQLPAMNGPPKEVRLDGAPIPLPAEGSPTIDTTRLSEGRHWLGWPGGHDDFCVPFEVKNGTAPDAPTGRFTDVTHELLGRDAASPTPVEQLSGVLTGDFDADGQPDLLVFGKDGARVLRWHAGAYEPGQQLPGAFTSGAAEDLDRDGWTDLILAGNSLNLFRNDHGTLVDATEGSGIPARSEIGAWFQMTTLTDLDQDGLADVAIGFISCGNTKPSLLLRNEGGLHFVDVAPALGFDFPNQATFGLTFDRPFGDDRLVAWSLFEGCAPRAPTLAFLAPGDDLPVVQDRPLQHGGGEVIMGSAWLDANADGVLDYFGTGTDFSPLAMGPSLLVDGAPEAGLMAFPDAKGQVMEQWSSPLFDLENDGLADLFVTQEHVPEPPDGHLLPRTRLLRQGPPGKFRDVAEITGAAITEHCEGAAIFDFDHDGDGDVFLRCEHAFHVLRNDVAPARSGRTIALRGTLSAAGAMDARLSSPGAELRLHRGGGQLHTGGTFPESLRISGPTLHVEWPSGLAEDVPAPNNTFAMLTEPEVVKLSRRRVTAGDPDGVQVEIRPAAAALAGEVRVALAGGSWSKPLEKSDDGVWRGTLGVPAEKGSIALSVHVGDQRLRVRPRVFVR